MIVIEVHGIPQPSGSKTGRPFQGKDGRLHVVMRDACKKSPEWKSRVADAAVKVYKAPLLIGPLTLSITFMFIRPKAHFGTGRNAGKLKASAPKYKTTKPDTTKLLRCTEDALTGVVWRDDSQIVEHRRTCKVYGERAGATIEIVELT